MSNSGPQSWERELLEKFASIGIDQDYHDLDLTGLQNDTQGWASEHPVFEQVIKAVKPRIVVEVGTWKGASVIHMRNLCQTLGLDTKFICVDTWLGSSRSMWMNPEYRESLMLQGGFPTMYRQFVFNILHHNAASDILPMPMTSTCAFAVLKRLDVMADLIYIDGGHEETDVWNDLCHYFQLLRVGGVIFGDDYDGSRLGLVRSVNRFAADHSLVLTCNGGKWRMRKPRRMQQFAQPDGRPELSAQD